MKKVLFITTFLLITASGLFAQKFDGGYSLGINATQVDGDYLSGYNKLGLNAGTFVSLPFNDKWLLRAEFLFTIKGAKRFIDEDNIGSSTDFNKMSAYYLEVPFMLKYRYKKIFAEAGVSGGLLIAATVTDYIGKRNITSSYKRYEIATHWGGGYHFTKHYSAFLRFSYSAFAVSKGPSGPLFSNPKLRPGYFHNLITIGVRKTFGR